MRALLIYGAVIAISVGLSVLASAWYQPQHTVSVDLHRLLQSQSADLASLPPPMANVKQREVAHRIDKVILLYQKATGNTILVSNAVVQGAPDITPQIEQLLK